MNVITVLLLIILITCNGIKIKIPSKSSSLSSPPSPLSPPSLSSPLSSPSSIKSKEQNNYLLNIMIASSILLPPKICHASKGAFEMDMDYYIRNIVSGSNIQSENEKKVRQSIYPSPRQMNIIITTKIINIIKRVLCKKSNLSIDQLNQYIAIELPKKLLKFKEYIPITNENFSDQYYFDIYVYLIYKAVENIIIKSEDRVILRQVVGDEILKQVAERLLAKIRINENAAEKLIAGNVNANMLN